MNGHTIFLVQFSSNEESRTYMDCKSTDAAFETFLRIYESFLMNKNSIIQLQKSEEGQQEQSLKIEYKLEDVCRFIDQLFDLGCMCFNERACGYTAHGKAWFKAKVHAYLRR